MGVMSTTPRRPRSSAKARPRSRPPAGDRQDPVNVALAAALAAGTVALIGIALALIVTLGSWALAPHAAETGPDVAARVAIGLWLYAQHVPLEIGTVSLGLVPLGLLVIPGALTYAGGRQVARVARPHSLADVTRAVIPFALVYGVLAAIAAGVVRSDVVQPDPRTAFLAGTAIAALGGGIGLLRASALLPTLVRLIPLPVRDLAAAAVSGLATLVLVSGVLTTLTLVVGFPDAAEAFRALGAGWAGAPVLVLLTVAFIPNLVLWTAAFTTGVGFPLGAEGMVSPQGIEYGALPVFPPLAALPPQGDPGPWAFVALAAPLLGGVAAAVVLHRRQRGLSGEQIAGRSAVAGALGGVGLGVLCWLSAGSVGSAALTELGPVGWRVGLVAALEMSLVASAVGWELHRRAGTSGSRLIDLRERVSVSGSLSHRVKAALRLK